MKKIFLGLMGFVGLMGLWACEKENRGEHAADGRDIFYTVSDEAGLAALAGTTIHLDTEAEWEALLDQFCDYAAGGEQVSFCGTSRPQLKDRTSTSPTSITTADREELKSWMKEMEKAGKTVHVTYNEGTGTWSGRAYANIAPQEGQADVQSYSGTLTFVPTPVLNNPPLGGVVMALQADASHTYILTVHGMLLWFDSEADNDELLTLLEGSEASFAGVAASHTDLDGNTFLSLDLEMPDSGVIEF